jgi:glutamyl-tRNA reductase
VERDLLIVGVNHRTAPVALRERLGFAAADLQPALARLLAVPGVQEGAIISTCNRVEVVTCVDAGAAAERDVSAFLARERNVEAGELAPHLYVRRGREAVRHLFRVASSLDSMVVGEPQILGQMKEHYAEATSAGASGSVLHRVFHRSFTVAKRVRTETAIAGKAVSVASVAVDLTRTIFEALEDKTAMLIGAGKMSELVARHLKAHGIAGIMVATRTFDHAVELARELGGVPVPFERMAEYLKLADVVIGSAGAATYLVTPATVQETLRARKQQPMFFVDMGVPRNFDPAINELDNVYLYDIDDLGRAAGDNAGEREREARRAEAIVDAEVDGFWHWLSTLEVVPTIVALRAKVEAIRRRELEKALTSLKDQAPRHRALLDALTSAIVNKILHAPIATLKRRDATMTQAELVATARQLFDLDPSPVPRRESGEEEE